MSRVSHQPDSSPEWDHQEDSIVADVTSKVCDKITDPEADVRCRKPVPEDKPTTFRVDGIPGEGKPDTDTSGVMIVSDDLCVEHKQELLTALRPFIESSTNIQVKVHEAYRSAFVSSGGDPVSIPTIRKWWKENQDKAIGRDNKPLPFTTSGRLPREVMDAYQTRGEKN